MESSNPEKCGRPRPHNNVQVVSDRPVPVTLRLEGKAMFSRLTAFIHQAAEQVLSDAVIDEKDEFDSFKCHWQRISEATTDNSESLTIIRDELKEMLRMLYSEERQIGSTDPGTLGTCMEFLLRHRLLDTLYTSGRNDYPKGMGKEVLQFFNDLLMNFKRPLLHHVSIIHPIILLVTDCGMDLSDSIQLEQVNFLRSICQRLVPESSLVDAFIQNSGENEVKTFLLSDALLRLTQSCSMGVVGHAFDSLLTVVSLSHPEAAAVMAVGKLPLVLASKLQYHFQLIPCNLVYTTILTCPTDWKDFPYGLLDQQSVSSNGVHVELFFFWLHYCQCVVSTSQERLAEAVTESIRELFLTASLLPKIVKVNEEDILISTSVFARSLQLLTCQRLRQEFVACAINNSSCPGGKIVREVLISRLDHVSEDVCFVNLHLWNNLLEADVMKVMGQLMGGVSLQAQWQVEEDCLQQVKTQAEDSAVAYLAVLPEVVCSSVIVSGMTGLDQYFSDAYHQVTEGHERSASTSSDVTTLTDNDLLVECDWIQMLLNKLESMLEQPFQMNLIITSILVKLAAAPFPALDGLFQTNSSQRNIYSILKQVAGTLQSRFTRTPALVVHLTEARRRLAGEVTSDLLSMPNNNFLEGAILLEELTKELSAIIAMKATQALLTP